MKRSYYVPALNATAESARYTNGNSLSNILIALLSLSFIALMSGVMIAPSQQLYSLANDNSRSWLSEVYRATRIAAILLVLMEARLLTFGLRDHRIITFSLLAAAASAIWSSNPLGTLNASLNMFLLFGFSYIGARRLGTSKMISLAWHVAALIIFTSVFFAAAKSAYAVMPGSGLWRGFFPHKNTFGPVCGTFIVATLLAKNVFPISRVRRWTALAVSTLGLIASGSAGGLVATAAALFTAYSYPSLVAMRRNSPNIFPFAMALLIIASGAALLLVPLVVGGLGKDLTLSGRTNLWAAIVPLTFSHPFGTGYGIAGGQAALELIGQRTRTIYRAIDSGYLVLALELGWPAVAAYMLALIRLAIPPVDGTSSAKRLLGSLAVFQLAISVSEKSGGPYPSLAMLFLFLGIIAARPQISNSARRAMPLHRGRQITPTLK
jgi:hypothetical protein